MVEEDGIEIPKYEDEESYLVARKGDDLMCMFQCDLCHFRNMESRNPDGGGTDEKILRYIRRANLDAFWARRPNTVYQHFLEMRSTLADADEMRMTPPFPERGPMALKDTSGMSAAVLLLKKSLRPGKYSNNNLTFDTTRKRRGAISSYWHGSVEGMRTSVLAKEEKKLMLTDSPTYSLWFERFIRGMHNRMGDDIRPDEGVDIELLHYMLNTLQECLDNTEDAGGRKRIIQLGFYLSATFSAGLRGNELFNLNLKGLLEHDQEASELGHVILPLLGRFKGETGLNYHLIPIAGVTTSGINNRYWMDAFLGTLNESSGWAFKMGTGIKMKQADLQEDFYALMDEVQNRTKLIDNKVDIREEYGLSRSLRRGSNTHAHNMGVKASQIELNNRWRKFFYAGGKRPGMGIRDSYIQIKQAMPALLKYSSAL